MGLAAVVKRPTMVVIIMVAVAAELVEVRRMQPTQQRNVLHFVAKNKFRMACVCVCVCVGACTKL